jgi:rhamnose utilization protein RhaD (predicted bifunctional aldolase and dehydrogenase)
MALQDVANEIRGKIAARNAEIATLTKNLPDLQAQRDTEVANLAALTTVAPDVAVSTDPKPVNPVNPSPIKPAA